MIERKLYIERIKPFINKNIIKVLTGQLSDFLTKFK